MSEAHVTHLEALERFRSSLVLFVERASLIVDEVSDEVKRTRIWLQTEQKLKIGQEMKRRERDLERLEQELFSARLSDNAQKKTGVQMQVNHRRRELRELESSLRALAGWLRNFDSTVEVKARKVEKLRHHLDIETVRAISFLAEAIRNLDAYAAGGDT